LDVHNYKQNFSWVHSFISWHNPFWYKQ